MKKNWKKKNLNELENNNWHPVEYESQLVSKVHELRNVPLDQFTIEDLRLMIGQEISLEYLIPMAIDVLEENLFAEGDYFEGDLLKNVMSVQ